MGRFLVIWTAFSCVLYVVQGVPVAQINGTPLTPNNNTRYELIPNTPSSNEMGELSDRTGFLGQTANAVGGALVSKGKCIVCVAAVALVQEKVRNGGTDKEVASILSEQCKLYRLQEPVVCDGVIGLFAPEVVYILNHTSLTPSEMCAFAFTDDCGDEFDRKHDWSVQIPPKPNTVRRQTEPAPNPPRRLKVLHLSDTHLDPYYVEGALADCNLPLCCRASSGNPNSGKRRAGKWGDYGKCDPPARLIQSALDHIAETHKDLDYILWTGDLQPHDVWNQTRDESINILRITTDMLMRAFPNVPVFPALGNHEAVPVNSFAPASLTGRFSMSWLYDEVAEQWSKWLPQDVSGLVRRGAFYSVPFKNGLRVISVNTNFCNDKNWWLLMNSNDPDQELEWLIQELVKAEAAGEKVHLVGHIPPGSKECRPVWSKNFDKIIQRFESTVVAMFFGHSHYDEFELFFDQSDLQNLRPTAVGYLGPSITSYEGQNPAYRIYYVDGAMPDSSWEVLDHDTWTMDLTSANRDGAPAWMRLYSARRAYNMPSLSAVSWTRLVRDMASNDELFNSFYGNYWRNSPGRPTCDAPCRRRLLCDLLQGRSRDTTPCKVIWRLYDSAHPTGSWWQLILSRLSGTSTFLWKTFSRMFKR